MPWLASLSSACLSLPRGRCLSICVGVFLSTCPANAYEGGQTGMFAASSKWSNPRCKFLHIYKLNNLLIIGPHFIQLLHFWETRGKINFASLDRPWGRLFLAGFSRSMESHLEVWHQACAACTSDFQIYFAYQTLFLFRVTFVTSSFHLYLLTMLCCLRKIKVGSRQYINLN